ncbi:MAG: ATP-binding protein [Alphaproteobacteria bacterium]|nr:ATP-binding protein [Alphaproteobacteria bacterium]MCZ6509219.1 ATP-binding protein [Alphaproteobacteria bacterium]
MTILDTVLLLALVVGGLGAAIILWRQAMAARTALAARDRLSATLTSAPAGYISWFAGEEQTMSAGSAAIVGIDSPSGYAGLRELFADSDRDSLDRMVENLRQRGEEFSVTLLTIDAGRAMQLNGRRARTSPLDVLWISDVTSETATQSDTSIQLTAAEVDRDGLRAMLDALPFPVWRRGKNLTLTQTNRAYMESVRSGNDDAEGGNAKLVEIDSGPEIQLASLAQATGVPQSESRHTVIGGERRLVEFNEMPSDMGIVGYATDFTQLENIQEELASHIAAHSDVLENVAAAIAIYGPDTRLKFYNAAYGRLWDADTVWLDTEPTLGEELETLRDRRMVTEEVDFRAFKADQIKLFTSLIAPTETLVHLPDGKTLFKRISPHPFGGLMFTYEDVTSRLSLERQYNTLIEVQRQTLDNLYEGVALVGADGRLKLCNSAFGRLWQLSTSELNGEPQMRDLVDKCRHFYPEELEWESQRRSIVNEMMSREPASGTLERTDGTVLEYTGVPLPDGMKLMTYLDVSDRNRVERALRERNEALEQADRLKSEFVANISYELRTPLNSIIGFSEMLSGEMFGTLNERQTGYVGDILQASGSLLDLINDLLDLATIEAGYMELERSEFEGHELVTSVAALHRERARQAELTLVVDCPEDIGQVYADERRLKQVLFNLVSNAIKFTPEGGTITLGARRSDSDIVFFASDTGVGIPEDEHDRVFEKFERGSGAAGPQSGVGAGLGLSLVKSLIELHGGDVQLESSPHEGTSVFCRLPTEPQEAIAATARSE